MNSAFSLFALWISLIAMGGPVSSAADSRLFVNRKFGYSFSVPRGWTIWSADVPVLTSYQRKKALPQGLIPFGGADIYLIPFQQVEVVTAARELNEWIQINGEKYHTNVRTKQIKSWSQDEKSPQKITRVDADFERAPEDQTLQSEVNYYFVLRGESFRLRLLYEKGDPHSSYFNSVIEAVLRSIKAR